MSQPFIEGYQLSPQQQRLWTMHQQLGDQGAHIAIRLTGPLDYGALERALRSVQERHEILRTTFRSLASMALPLQVPVNESPVRLDHVDLAGIDSFHRTAALRAYWNEDRLARFDLEAGPVARFQLVRLEPATHVLMASVSALCADSPTLAGFFDELCALFQADRTGELPAPVQHVTYSEWLHEILTETCTHWSGQLLEQVPSASLPFERNGSTRLRPDSVESLIKGASSGRLEMVARQRHTSPATVVFTCWQLALAKLAARDDSVIYHALDGRKYDELRRTFGPMSVYAPIRQQIRASDSCEALIDRAASALTEAIEWLEFAPSPEISHAANACPVAFEACALPEARTIDGVRFEVERQTAAAGCFKLHLCFSHSPEVKRLDLHYDPNVYDRDTAERVLGSTRAILEQVTKDPAMTVRECSALSAVDRDFLAAWSPPETPVGDVCPLHALIEARAVAAPNAVAVADSVATLTFGALNIRANQIARCLVGRGVGPESRVAILLHRTVEAIAAIVAVLKAGGAYVPLDVGQPPRRVADILSDAQADAVLTVSGLAAALPACDAHVICLDAEEQQIGSLDPSNLALPVLPEQLAYVIYTSGSTGLPKGVMIEHRAVANLAAALEEQIYGHHADVTRVGVNAPLAFDASVKQLMQLAAGRELHVLPDSVRQDGRQMLLYAARHAIHGLDCTPATLKQLLAADLRSHPTLRLILVGGAPIDDESWKTFGDQSRVAGYNLYGPTECTVDATCAPINRQTPTAVLGRPLKNVRVSLLDSSGLPVPIGQSGELHLGGTGVGRGYFRKPELTALAFVPDPQSASPGARQYRSGDLARFGRDRTLQFLRRRDLQVKIRGYRVELGEVEATLARHPEVSEAAVAVHPDASGESTIVAYLVYREGHRASPESLRSYLLDRIPQYMVPSDYVTLDWLPVNRNGKLDRFALPPPGGGRGAAASKYVAPRNPAELRMVHIWEQLLGKRPIGIHDDFFELGGHSFLAVRLVACIQTEFGQSIPLTALFTASTVAELAALVHRPFSAATSPLVALQPKGPNAPLFCIHPIGGGVLCYVDLARILGPDQPFYGLGDVWMGDIEAAPASIETMAAAYLAAIRDVQPRGPYQLGGWSFGGLVAFEMAQQLVRADESVTLLALLDCRPRGGESHQHLSDTDLLLEIVRSMTGRPSTDQLVTAAEIGERLPEQRWGLIRERLVGAGLLGPEIQAAHVCDYVRRHRIKERARAAYEPQRYPGRITLFRARDAGGPDGTENEAPDYGWSDLATGGVDLEIVPGHHLTMIYPPHIDGLASRMQPYLAGAARVAS